MKLGGTRRRSADNGEYAAVRALASSLHPGARGETANGGPGILRGAAGGGRLAARGALLGLSATAGSGKCRRRRLFPVWRGPSICGRRRALLAMSEPLPAFLDRLWGPWLGTLTPPMRGLATASPSKVASPSTLPGQSRFPSGVVTLESPSSGLRWKGTWSLFFQCVTSLIK